jgi:PmbA protein
MDQPEQLTDIASQILERARKHGADAAEAVIVEGTSMTAGCRLSETEDIERSEMRDLGLRVFIGRAQANVSTTDFHPDQLDAMAERAVAMAKASPEDPYCGLADDDRLATAWPDLDLYDATEVSSETLGAMARAAEETALARQGITNSLGAQASCGTGGVVLATSHGFLGSYRSSGFSLSCAVVAGEGTAMERDYESTRAVYFADLEDAAGIGASAAERALKRLKPRKVKSQTASVVFDPRVSNTLVGHLASAIIGTAVARGTSFLKDRMDAQVFARGITIVDDPHRRRGLRSKPYDGEGVANARIVLVDDGVLSTWLLDSRSARQLGLATTGHASRGTAGPPSPSATNLYLEAGAVTREALIAGIDSGFYVTDLIGMGVNGVTGDYSRGAAGFWIEKGEIAYPVSEVTIAGNLTAMYANMTAADDLSFRYGVNAPTVLIEGLTIAGN